MVEQRTEQRVQIDGVFIMNRINLGRHAVSSFPKLNGRLNVYIAINLNQSGRCVVQVIDRHRNLAQDSSRRSRMAERFVAPGGRAIPGS
jgi:hypothetical protein